MTRHASLVALRVAGRWRGALVEGPSGSGKSDLVLRVLEAGFRLAADDRVIVFISGGRLFGRAPEPLKGLVEARGVGLANVTPLPFTEIALAVRCAASAQSVERMPQRRAIALLGIETPCIELWPLEPSAPVKLRLALEYLGASGQRAYQAGGS